MIEQFQDGLRNRPHVGEFLIVREHITGGIDHQDSVRG